MGAENSNFRSKPKRSILTLIMPAGYDVCETPILTSIETECVCWLLSNFCAPVPVKLDCMAVLEFGNWFV